MQIGWEWVFVGFFIAMVLDVYPGTERRVFAANSGSQSQ